MTKKRRGKGASGRCSARVQSMAAPTRITPTPFTPENIYGDGAGRWIHDGVDVSDRAVWWRCASGHSYQASIARRPEGDGCPACKYMNGSV